MQVENPMQVQSAEVPLSTLANGDTFWHSGTLFMKCTATSLNGYTVPVGKVVTLRLVDGVLDDVWSETQNVLPIPYKAIPV